MSIQSIQCTFPNKTAADRAARAYRKQFDIGLDGEPRVRGGKPQRWQACPHGEARFDGWREVEILKTTRAGWRVKWLSGWRANQVSFITQNSWRVSPHDM